MVEPQLKAQVQGATTVSYSRWMDAVAYSTPGRSEAWEREIIAQGWFTDTVVQKYLEDYSEAAEESERYPPFVHLANHLVDMARGRLTGIAKKKPSPTNKLIFLVNAHNAIAKDKAQDPKVAACRIPDVILTRPLSKAEEKRRAASDKSLRSWPEVHQFLEFKMRQKLGAMLHQERTKTAVPPHQAPPKVSDMGPPKGRENLRSQQRPHPVSCVPSAGVAGVSGPSTAASVHNARKRLHSESSANDQPDAPRASNAKKLKVTAAGLVTGADSDAVQAASYALELMASSQGTRLYCLGHIVKDDLITPWYYDASGMVCTDEPISMIRQFPKFAAFIVAMASLTLEEHGAMPASAMRLPGGTSPSFDSLTGRTITMYTKEEDKKTAVEVTLGKHVFSQYSLVGRRTFLYDAQLEKSGGTQEVVVKFSYQVEGREREQDLVTRARKFEIPHLPTIEMSADLWKMSDGIRSRFHGKAIDGTEPVYDVRSLRAIMYHRYRPLKELFAEHCLLIAVMVDQMIDCLTALIRKAGILHCDISANNIMYEKTKDGEYNFVLIDFDMAIIAAKSEEPGDSSVATACRNCTGTLPFMARELIRDAYNRKHLKGWTPVLHRLRHDLESLFFVSIWCLCLFVRAGLEKPQKTILKNTMVAWERASDLITIADKKDACCVLGHRLVFSAAADPLRAWLDAWTVLFLQSDSVTQAHVRQAALLALVGKSVSFDWETLNGTLTPEVLKEALTPHMPVDATETVLDSFVLAPAYGLTPGSKPPVVKVDETKTPAKKFTVPQEAAAQDTSEVSAATTANGRTSRTKGARRQPANATSRRPAAAARHPKAASTAGPSNAAEQAAHGAMRSRLRPRKDIHYF